MPNKSKIICATCTYWLLVIVGYLILGFTSVKLLNSQPVIKVEFEPHKCATFGHPTTLNADCFYFQKKLTAYKHEI